MKKIIYIFFMTVLFTACGSKQEKQVVNQSVSHKVVVQEVIQVSEYSYIRAIENGEEKWFAAPTFQAEIGKTYYFKKGMEMPNFESNELKRTFSSIYFVEKMSATPIIVDVVKEAVVPLGGVDLSKQATKPVIEKANIKIKATKGVITIAQLFSNMKKYDGKTVSVKGKVTKYNPEIMNKNWIHLQDGTAHGDDFDLTATTNAILNVGDIITIKGKISLNKDFGFGYFYKLILEDAAITK